MTFFYDGINPGEVSPLNLGEAAELLRALKEVREIYRPAGMIYVTAPAIDARVEAIDRAVVVVCKMIEELERKPTTGGAS